MTEQFNKRLVDLLKTVPHFVDDNGELVKSAVIDAAWKIDHNFIKLLLKEDKIKEKFFDEIDGYWIFNFNKFIEYVSDKSFLDNSYTRFGKKIGLTIDGKFLSERGDVALVWPYKDCVLEGGQTKEEEKRKEIFFNEVLAQDEIDRLYDPKILTNWKRYTVDGWEKIEEIKRDEDGTIRENLIIKGNNLLALHSLKSQFRGKIKLIYIDPPYNTGNDEFGYNDNFSHSSWLTFMKNRLEVAKDLLREDGVILVQCDDNEQAYLKVLMDDNDVFGRDNFINNIIPVMNPRGRQESSYPIAKSHEYLLMYSKKAGMATLYNINKTKSDKKSEHRLLALRKSGNASRRIDRPNMYYPIYYNRDLDEISTEPKDGYDVEVLPIKTKDNSEGRWRWSKKNVEANKHLLKVQKNSKNRYDVYEINYTIIDGEAKGNKIQTFIKDEKIINDKAKEHLENLFGKSVFDHPKSEYLLKMIVEFTTKPGDIILDFFMGSGTTCTVAHKMKRQYIGVEQMDYVEKVTVERLKKVVGEEAKATNKLSEKLTYDSGGISKSVNWQGGGDFIYVELMKYNEAFIDKIQCAKTSEELVEIWKDIAENSFLNWYVNPHVPEESIDDFKKIGKEENGLEKQKKLLIKLLNKNQLYVNLSEIEDQKFQVEDEDKKLNKEFYGEAYNG